MGKRLHIQLYCARTGESITLPISPESIDITNEKEVKTYNILKFGEMAVRGGKKLKNLSLSNMFPDDTSYFALLASLVRQLQYKEYKQQETVDMVNHWVDNDEIIRVIISGYLNGEYTIEKYTSQVKEPTSNLGYTIDLVEYRNPEKPLKAYVKEKSNLEKLRDKAAEKLNKKGSTTAKVINYVKLKARTINKYIPAQITAKKGQTIYKIAKLTYGDKWIELRDRNHLTDANLDLAGKIVEMLPL